MSKKGQNSNNKNLVVELEKKLIERKEAKQFKSRDDFIELACHDFLVRRNPAGELHS